MKNLKGKLVLITGGARGLGYAHATAFAREGANLILVDVNQEQVEESAAKLSGEFGIQAEGLKMDVTSTADIQRVFDYVKEKYLGLDVLVNNAGIQIRCPSANFSESDYDKLMSVNLKGAFFCSQAAYNLMKGKGGAIVNISSGTSTQTTPGRAPYVISKAGVNGMTAVLASEWARDGVRVNAVAPGWILTEMVKDGFRLGVVSEKQILAAVPIKRLADPSEIADAVVYLASSEASYITGQTLFVDGGWSALGMPDIEL